MEYSYIINPLTNRKVSINTRKGQSILKAYLNQAQYAQAGGRRGRRSRGRKEDHSEHQATTFNKEGDPFFPEGYEPEQHSPEIAENRERVRQEIWAKERQKRQQRESKDDHQDHQDLQEHQVLRMTDGPNPIADEPPAKASSSKQGECRYNPSSKRCGRSSKHTLETDPETGITHCTESGGTKGQKYRACHHSDEWKAHLRGHRGKSQKPVRVEKTPELEEEVDYWSVGQDEPGEGWSERTGDDESEAWDEREWAKDIEDEPETSEDEESSDEDVSSSEEEEDTPESESDSDSEKEPHPIFGKVCQGKEEKVCQELHQRGLCNWYEHKPCEGKEKGDCQKPHGKKPKFCNWNQREKKCENTVKTKVTKPYCRSTGKFGALNPESRSKR